MPKTIMRTTLDALLPPGAIWVPKEGGDFDLLLEGIADNLELVRKDLSDLAVLRNPQKTTILSDLEKEYGLTDNGTLTEQERRDRLEAAKTASNGTGTAEFVQEKLQEAGFNVFVYPNDPPVDPSIFIEQAFKAVCGFQTSVCGNENAVCANFGGQLVVNGEIILETPNFSIVAGGEKSVCGNADAIFGAFTGTTETPVIYEIPDDSGYWGLFFFIGGAATFDPVTGALISIDIVSIPAERKDELISLIIKYKPMHSWCGLIVDFV